MKRKKALFLQRFSGKEDRGTVIGIAGAKRGVGTTHFSILLAEYLSIEKGAKTAILEYSRHGDFKRIKQAEGFSMKQTAYYDETEDKNIEKLLQEGFSFLILDLGEKIIGNRELLSKCHKKILVGTLSPWKREDFFRIGKSMAVHEGDWLLLSNMGEERLRKQYERLLGMPIQRLPYCPLGKQPPKEVRRLLSEVSGEGMNEKNKL